MAGPGINGIGVATIATGMIILWSGLKNATVLDTVRALVRGEPIPSKGSEIEAAKDFVAPKMGGRIADVTAGNGNATGAAVAADAVRYVGVKYVWAGADPDNGWDCSGFVTYVLHHDFGLELPDNRHTLTYAYYTWTGATTVDRSQCQPGDLVCWWSHIGIAVDADNMVNAPGIGIPTRIQPIGAGALIRRPNAYGTAGTGKKGGS